MEFDRKQLVVEIPNDVEVDRYAPVTTDSQRGFEDFRSQFELGGGRQVIGSESPLIIVNDGYRHTPTSMTLGWLDKLDDSLLDGASYLVSTGTHQAPTDAHYEQIFGPHYDRVKKRVSYHDATDRSSMTLVGRDRFGCEVYLNSAVLRAGQVIVIGSVEPHYFAGYTGGRKSIFPGLTDLATVERNHNLANSLEAAPLKLAGNPMAEHLEDLMGLINQDKLFGIQIVTDARHQVAGIFCGPLEKGFQDAVDLAAGIFAHSVAHQYDVVLCELLPPLDKNLYQVQKALENCQAAVTDGGSAVVVAACEEGVGSDYFFDLAARWNRDLNIPYDGKPAFGSHKLSRVNSMSRRIDVRLYSRLPDESPRRVFYEPLHDIEGFLKNKAEERTLFKMAVVHDAGHTVLKVN